MWDELKVNDKQGLNANMTLLDSVGEKALDGCK